METDPQSYLIRNNAFSKLEVSLHIQKCLGPIVCNWIKMQIHRIVFGLYVRNTIHTKLNSIGGKLFFH